MDRPQVFLDLETTGTDVRKDRIVEIAMMKEGDSRRYLINPTIPIPKGASDVHGITDEDVKDKKTFKEASSDIMQFIQGCDIVGYNSINYDIPLLYNEFARAGINWDYSEVNFIDVCNIFKIKEQRTLSAAVKFYTGRDHIEAHEAMGDVSATIDVFRKQIELYNLGGMSSKELALMSNYDRPILDISGKFTMDNGEVVFTFGQHKGKIAKKEKGYLEWMLKADFSEDTKQVIRKLLK